jgi:hypothetical protein
MMSLLGIGLFVVIFLMLMPSYRGMLENSLAGTGDWIAKYAPFSYVALLIVLVVPLLVVVVVMSKREPPEPENPLAKYKAEDVLED